MNRLRRTFVTLLAMAVVFLLPAKAMASGESDCFVWYFAQTDIGGTVRCAAIDGRLIVGTNNNLVTYSAAISHKDLYCANSDPLPANYIYGGAYTVYHNNTSTVCFWAPGYYNSTTRDTVWWSGNYSPTCGSGTYRVLAQGQVARNFAWQAGACWTAWVTQ